jgi:uncharacterized protein (TIGR02996 family)
MPDNDSFVQAIAAEPSDDTRRLVYADWLEEQGVQGSADYLRLELELAKLPASSPNAGRYRDQLWNAWANVDPQWLLIFTQPRMLRANPTPFPSAWINFGLGSVRERQGTYGTWPYDSIPPLKIEELRGEFQYLDRLTVRPSAGDEEHLADHRSEFARMVADASQRGLTLPDVFVRFMSDPGLNSTIDSVTGCSFTLPDEFSPIRESPKGEGTHVHFYCDSQSCVLWDLLIHRNGAHCVIARSLDFFDPQPPDPHDDQPLYDGPRAWFVAPSFETFLYRVWVENQIWYVEHSDYLRETGESPPPITPALQAYMDHYRNNRTRS